MTDRTLLELILTGFLNADLCSCDPQMTSSRPWALNRARPLLRGRGPPPASTDPDWALIQQAQPWTCPSWAPLSRGPCPVAPLYSPHVRDHTPWTSLKCVPVWSPHWHAETHQVLNLAVTWGGGLPLSVSSFSRGQLYVESNACHLTLRRHIEEASYKKHRLIASFSHFDCPWVSVVEFKHQAWACGNWSWDWNLWKRGGQQRSGSLSLLQKYLKFMINCWNVISHHNT